MESIILFLHVIIALSLIALILLQQGKGAQMGAAFGSGSSNTLFGSRGPASFLMKLTGTLVALFFITSITLGRIAANDAEASGQLVQQQPAAPLQQTTVPASTQIKTVPQGTTTAPVNNHSQVPVK